jgi:glycosyltransferase involved in cell wall biosynthesis
VISAESFADRPCRVAHIVRPAEGGIRAQVRSLLDGLTDVQAIVAAAPGLLQALGRAADAGDLPLPDQIGVYAMVRKGHAVGDWARGTRAHVLHGHGVRYLPLFTVAARRARLPLVVTVHNLLPLPGGLVRLALRRLLRQPTRLIAVSEAVAASIRALIGATDRIVVIRNGIDVDAYAPREDSDRVATRAALGIPADAPLVICIARLSPEKNVASLIEAAPGVLGSGVAPDTCFVVAGDGPERAALAARIDALGMGERFRLLGARSDVSALLRAADVFVAPSREEGLGLAAIEAMAAGLPVVASAVGGLKEVVQDGVTGFLVPPAAPAQISRALLEILTTPERAHAFSAAGRERARICFRAETMLRATRALYAEVAGR